jgi:hypothetical protein
MTKGGVPDGSAHAAYIYNKTPKEFRKLIHVHFLDKQPVRLPGLSGFPQLFDSAKNVFIPYGTNTILSLLHMVRNAGIDIRMANLHPSSARFDAGLVAHAPLGAGRGGAHASGGKHRDKDLSTWKSKIEQNDKNPYDPRMRADESVRRDEDHKGDFLDGAALGGRFNDCADVNVFDTDARDGSGEYTHGSPIDEFDYVDIDESKTSTSKISEAEMSAYSNAREKHWNELKSRMPAPKGRSAVV